MITDDDYICELVALNDELVAALRAVDQMLKQVGFPVVAVPVVEQMRAALKRYDE